MTQVSTSKTIDGKKKRMITRDNRDSSNKGDIGAKSNSCNNNNSDLSIYSINDTRNNNKNVIKKRIIIIIRIKILMTIIIISV